MSETQEVVTKPKAEKEKVTCPCGSVITKGGETNHNKTKKHMKWEDENGVPRSVKPSKGKGVSIADPEHYIVPIPSRLQEEEEEMDPLEQDILDIKEMLEGIRTCLETLLNRK